MNQPGKSILKIPNQKERFRKFSNQGTLKNGKPLKVTFKKVISPESPVKNPIVIDQSTVIDQPKGTAKSVSSTKTLKKKISEILDFGNIYAALKFGYLTGSEAINWLIHHNRELNPAIINFYRAVCLISPEEDQIESTENGKIHFLELSINSKNSHQMTIYRQIYILTHKNREFYGSSQDTDSKEIHKRLISILGPESLKIHQGKVDQLVKAYLHPKNFTTMLGRSFLFDNHLGETINTISKEYILECIYLAIMNDYFSWITEHLADIENHHKERFLEILTERSKILSDKAQNYWKKVSQPNFGNLLRKLNLTLSQKARLVQFYPEIAPEITNLSDLSLKVLSRKCSFQRGYLLGFPIDRYLPKEKELSQAATHLTNLGIDRYTALMKIHTKKRISHLCQNNGLPSSWYVPEESHLNISESYQFDPAIIKKDQKIEAPKNDSNLVSDDYYEFSPFDILPIQSGERLYVFTRDEFPDLIRRKKNMYTEESLDPGIIHLLEDRLRRAKIMKLPKPITLSELLHKYNQIKDELETFPTLVQENLYSLITGNHPDTDFGIINRLDLDSRPNPMGQRLIIQDNSTIYALSPWSSTTHRSGQHSSRSPPSTSTP